MHTASPLKVFLNKQRKIPETIQIRFLKRLERFLINGYSLQDALEATAWDKDLASISLYFLEKLKEGIRLDTIFEQAGFHPSISSFLYFINANSDLKEAVGKCLELVEHHFQNVRKFKQIIRYPLFLLLIFSVVLFFINHRVLPAFQSLFTSSPETQTTINLLKWLMDLIQFSAIFIIVLSILFTIIWRYVRPRISMEEQLKVIERIPFYRYYLRLQTSLQLSTHFSSLLKAGLSLKEILAELARQNRLPIISYYATLLTNNLERGYHISNLLEELPLIEKQLAAIFQKNTTIPVLEKDLTLYSDMLLDEMERMMIRVITSIQPVFYTVLGVFIVFIYLSMMLPMFQLMNSF
ncbi:type II secretion system F family protein [Oceanobacillus alkalisoli]|uniref:type II secretion system F family protein n=1 Tax=Oceanobacillus alkalisoli TaxID=2925113 RepID=UPI001F11A603|nr:type II secretion system F family protein [Oceanobacillus alkalisoli]MCF3941760.1 type II secretion system F family protein [Oceanobacillus alkalisoli]